MGDRLFREFVLPGGDTGFWGVGIGNDEVILYLDESQARRVVEVPSEVDGGVKVRVIKARRPRAL